ncbi:hypothetical protein [Streptomyces sp. NPDC058495]|uniref:hypothetical protein n=1 Tax=unclassified Streptomyces TaxID=2593676 RepID=UPI0036512D92
MEHSTPRFLGPFARSPHRHYGPRIIISGFLASALLTWVLPDGPLRSILGWVTTAGTALGCVLWMGHLRGPLCETCISEMPLDAAEQAQTRLPLLRYTHWITMWRSFGILGSLYALPLILLAVADSDSRLIRIVKPLPAAYLAAEIWSTQTHRRLQPWCPLCRRRGPGHDENVDTPAPVVPQNA